MNDPKSKIPVVFLHGFTGSVDDWSDLAKKLENLCEPISVNLAGHGPSDHPADISEYTIDAEIDRLLRIVKSRMIETFVLVGYSMGGRIALSFACRYPNRLRGLILESTTAGIEDEDERKLRVKNDEDLACFIESNDIEVFVDRWMSLPLFGSQNKMPADRLVELRTRKLRNSGKALANSLRAAGTGRMKPLWDCISNLTMPVLLISGSLDTKFTEINKKMASLIPNCKHIVSDDAGHTVHFEKPEMYHQVVKDFISNGMEKH